MFSRIALKAAKPSAAGVAGLKLQSRFISVTAFRARAAELGHVAQGSKGRQMPSRPTRPTAPASGNEATLTIRVRAAPFRDPSALATPTDHFNRMVPFSMGLPSVPTRIFQARPSSLPHLLVTPSR